MRLIDLDQEIFVPIYDEAQGITYEQIMTVADMFDKFMSGYQPPIVDAIPVEWLRQYQGRMPNTAAVMGVDVILMMWQKEQEAQDE